MKRKIHLRKNSWGRRGAAGSAALLASVIMAGTASAQVVYNSDTVINNPTRHESQSALVGVTVNNNAHLTPSASGGTIEASGGYTLQSGFIENVSLNNGRVWTDPGGGNPGYWSYTSVGLTKNTDGVATLVGESFYTGATNITQGVLVLGDGTRTASLVGTSGVTIGLGGRLRLDFGSNTFSHNGTFIANGGIFEVVNSAGQTTAISGVAINSISNASRFLVNGSAGTATGGGITEITNSTISAVSHVIDSGTERVGPGATLRVDGIKVGESSSATLDVNGGVIRGLANTHSHIVLALDGSQLIVRDGGSVTANVNHVADNTNFVSIASSGSLTGNVALNDGEISVEDSGRLQGDASLSSGAVLVQTGGTITGKTTITEGRIEVSGASAIGDAHVSSGEILLSGSSTGADLTVLSGAIALDSHSTAGDLDVTDGVVLLNDHSSATSIRVTAGGVLVDNNSSSGPITVATGDVMVDNNSLAEGITVTAGDVLVNNGSSASDIVVTTGLIEINRSAAEGDIINYDGDINVSASALNNVTAFVKEGTISLYESAVTTTGTSSRSSLSADRGLVSIAGDSYVDADIAVSRGTGTNNLAVNIEGRNYVNGNIDVQFGLAQIHGIDTEVHGNVNIDEGDLIVADHAYLNGFTTIHDGSVNLHNGGEIDGGIDITHIGAVSLKNNSIINGEIWVNQATDGQNAVQIDDYSAVNGSVAIGIGNLLVNDHSGIYDPSGFIEIYEKGSVEARDSSHIITGDIYVNQGDVIARAKSLIASSGDIGIENGGLGADDSQIYAENDIFIANGSLGAYNDSRIRAGDDIVLLNGDLKSIDNSRVTAEDDIVLLDGNIEALNNSRVRAWDDIFVRNGNILAYNDSRVTAFDDITLLNGGIEALNGSRVTAGDDIRLLNGGITAIDSRIRAGDRISLRNGNVDLNNSTLRSRTLYSHEGNILLNNNSTVVSRTTINDGLLWIDETSRHIGRVNVNGDASAWVEGTVRGSVSLRDGTDDVDGGFLFGENVTITRNLFNNGVVAPGSPNSLIGTVNVGNNFYQLPEGTYLVDILDKNNFDQILVGGSATINGGSLYVDRHGYKPYRRDSWSIIEAQDGVNLVDAYTVHHNFDKNTMLETEVHYHDTSVEVYIKQLKFEPRGKTPNQRSVGRALDYAAKRDQLDPLFDHLNYTGRKNIPGLLRLLSPETLATIFNVGFANAQIQNVNIERRLDDVRHGSRGFSSNGLALSNNRGTINFDGAPVINDRDGLSLAGFDGKTIVTKEVVAPIVEQSPWGFFVTGSGEWADVESSYEAKGGDFASGGVTVGADYRASDNFVVGLFGGYVHTKTDLNLGGDIKANGARLGLYGSYFTNGFYVNALASGGYNHYKINRNTVGGLARGKTDGGQFDALLGAGYDFSLGCVTLGPVGSLQYSYVGFDKYSEHGSDARLHVSKNSHDSLRTLLGAKLATSWNVGGMTLRPEVRAQWKHEYLDREGAIDSSFTGSGAIFTVHGPKVGRDSLVIDAGASLDVSDTFSVYAYYTGELARQNYSSNSVNGGFRISF